MNLQRPAAGVEHQQADARTVPQPLAGVSAVGQARHHLQLPTLGQPVEWRPGRVEPAVETIEPVQQAPREFVLHAAAGDLPELRTAVAGADVHFVDEGVMHVAGEHHVVTGRSRVAEDIHHHVSGATVRHPVLGIDQQRLPGPAEDALDHLDQLDAEHRRRRDDQHRRFVEDVLLQFAERFPVHQARRATEVALAAPAPGARIEHHQRRIGGQLIAPAVEPEQLVDQLILGGAIEPAGGRRFQQPLRLLQPFAEAFRLVAPGLTQQVGDQRVADDPPRQRMAVGGLLPASREVPVVGDVVVVEDHQRRNVRQRPGRLRQALPEALQAVLFAAVAFGLLGIERRHRRLDQRPGQRRPDQQVHGHDFAKGDQVVVPVGGGEHRLFHAAEEAFAQRLVGLERRQQILAPVIGRRVVEQLFAVGDHRALQPLAVQTEAAHQPVNGHQHRPGDIVGVHLVAGHQQHRGAARGIVELAGEQLIDAQQAVRRRVVRLATGAMQHAVEPGLVDETGPRPPRVQQMRRPVGDALLRQPFATDAQVVLDHAIARQRLIQRHIDQMQQRIATDGQTLAFRLVQRDDARLGICPALQNQRKRQRAGSDQPEHQPSGLDTAQQWAGKNRRQGFGNGGKISQGRHSQWETEVRALGSPCQRWAPARR